MSYPSNLGYSRITDHNRYPSTDVLYQPLRKVLLRPNEVAQDQPYLNPAASQSRITREFAYITQNQAHNLRDQILIPVDKPLVPTNDLYKVRNSRFMVVDAKQYAVGAPITIQQMQRIRNQGLKQQRIVYDFGGPRTIIQHDKDAGVVIQPEIQPIVRRTKIIRQAPPSYIPPNIDDDQYQYVKETRGEYKSDKKYKYNLYSMLDQQVNGGGCGCPANEIIASRNEPQSINWLN